MAIRRLSPPPLLAALGAPTVGVSQALAGGRAASALGAGDGGEDGMGLIGRRPDPAADKGSNICTRNQAVSFALGRAQYRSGGPGLAISPNPGQARQFRPASAGPPRLIDRQKTPHFQNCRF
jgi:hypothetical protein